MRGIGKRLAGAGVVAALALVTACSGNGTTTVKSAASAKSARSASHGGSVSASASPNGPTVTIAPANGSKNADPSAGITVTAARGTLQNVAVHTSGDPVPGSIGRGDTVWHSTWTLDVSQSYTVTATASWHGTTSTTTSSFRTLTPVRTFSAQIFEGYQQTYGVGMPVILYFSQRITDKAAPGVYGYHTLTQTFQIGSSLIAVGNTQTHRTQIYYNGKRRYDWPISSGKPGDDTPDGSYLTIEKENPVRMIGPGYDLLVPWSVRFTFSGDYYHDAYWSVGEQGFENVSHGCVNLSPADAETYYKLAVPGDPITIIGSPKGGTWDNGWTEWFLTWNQYLKGSALHEAVEAGPHGSTFVSPSALPPDTAKAPLQTAVANNAAAD
jgi:lipoprotein-anchoring transpeptidase ErfK/SrfK